MVLVALIGNSMAIGPIAPATMKYPNGYSVSNATFNFEQSVQGNGYHMSYIYAKAGGTAMKNYAHGSGSLDSEATLTWQHLTEKTHNAYPWHPRGRARWSCEQGLSAWWAQVQASTFRTRCG